MTHMMQLSDKLLDLILELGQQDSAEYGTEQRCMDLREAKKIILEIDNFFTIFEKVSYPLDLQKTG